MMGTKRWNVDSPNGQPQAADGKTSEPMRFKRLTCAELDAGNYDLEYLIEGALVAGQPCILAGGKKNLKTSLMIDLGISLAVGGCFLGRLRVNRPCRVGIMSGESGMGTIQETARRIARAAGHKLADIEGLFWSDELPEFGNLLHEDALREFITTDKLEVLAIDPAYFCLPDVDHANLFQVGKQLRGVFRLCQETGALLLLAHHTRKNKPDPFSPPELEDIAWAGFQEACRQWLLVGRRERYQEGTGVHRLWLSLGGSAGHSDLLAVDISEGTRATPGGRFWQVDVMQADEAREQVKGQREAARDQAQREKAAAALDSDRREIVGMMAKSKKPDTKTDLRTRWPHGNTRFNRAFASLVDDGTFQAAEVRKGNGQTYEGWELRKAET